MKNVFYSNSREEDLVRWAGYLKALGDVITSLGADRDGSGGDTLAYVGGDLGMIIRDYAEAIDEAVGKAYFVLREFFKDESLSQDLKREIDHLQRRPYCPYDVKAAEGALERIEAFEQEASSVARLKPAFLDIREAAIKQFGRPEEKKAHAAQQAA